MKFRVEEAKSPVKFPSGSAARRDLIPALKGYISTNRVHKTDDEL
jgi:hypothetical protein